jgi:membrane fusion protein (multidrug efflux system)
MKPITGWSLVFVAAVSISAAVWARHNAKPAPGSADAVAAEPVAQVRTELATEKVLLETLNAFGDVSAGQLAGLSFARAGQVTVLHVQPGDRVAKGTLLATQSLDPAAREAYAQATNALALARREADRLRQLSELQLATQSQVDTAQKSVQDASSAAKALDAQGGASTSSTIVAPFNGVVAGLLVAQGDRVTAGAPILQLARADALRVQIGIEPGQLQRVHAGTKASLVPIAALSADSQSQSQSAIEASVASVQDIVDPKTQLVSAIVTLPRNAAAQLVPGMKVRATLEVGSLHAIAVPRNAVLADANGDYVFQVSSGKARRVKVSQQMESAGLVAISGLNDLKLPVVTVGNYELQDGMAVKEINP